MPKFRTMRQGTPANATHLLNPDRYVTPIGKILRKLSIDEHPTPYSILKAYMSFVRPCPPLFKLEDMVVLRTSI
jgi:O-antigen biosynthesis protein WbqP